MKSFSINRQLITSTMKPNKESERVAAAKGIIDLIVDIDESVTNAFENLEAIIKKSGLSLEGLTSIGADNTNVNMDNTHTLFHNQIKNQFKGIALTAFSRAATRVQELKSYYEFDEKDSQIRFNFFFPINGQEEIHNSSTTSIHQSEADEEDEEEQTKVTRSDQL
ncbi:unnamed protein product [Rotaria magnacalcarata]|uniref:Uncharacterized protein n=1 Tax=Rotaria magnacalcarata TaxID=392030 RepID=A0A815Y3V5_9BILA|nr:unnamed protein product [Rotaria magnacalcarata]